MPTTSTLGPNVPTKAFVTESLVSVAVSLAMMVLLANALCVPQTVTDAVHAYQRSILHQKQAAFTLNLGMR